MRLHVNVVLSLGVVLLACGDDDGADPASSSARGSTALANAIHFAGGVTRPGGLPPTTDGTVELDDAATLARLEPGGAGLLPFDETHPDDDDGPQAVLLQFDAEDEHIEVPVSNSTEGPGELNFAFELDDDVCDELCNRRYTIPLHCVLQLEGGDVGARHQTEVVLDCRVRGDEEHCEDGEQSEPAPVGPSDGGTDDAATTPQPDAQIDGGIALGADVIGAAGGTIELSDGAATVIPMGALTMDTRITLEVVNATAELPQGFTKVSRDYAFEPHGKTFDVPVEIRLPYTGDAAGLQVFRLDDEMDSSWEPAEAAPTFDAGVAVLEVERFSVYAVGRQDAGDGGTAQYPGVPVVLVPFPHINAATVIEVDDEYVYWTSSWVGPEPADPLPPASGSYVMRIPKEGGTPEAIYEAPAGENPIEQGSFALSDTSVYIERGIDIYHSSLIKVAKDGSSAVEIAQPEFNNGAGFAIDSQRVYFGGNAAGNIQSVPLDGGPISTVVLGNVEPAQLPIEPGSGNEIPWQGIQGMMSDGTNLYYACGPNGHMMQVPVGGGVPRILFQADPTAAIITGYVSNTSWPCVTGGFVYWQNYGFVFKTSIDEGGTPTPVVTPSPAVPGSGSQTVTDGDYLYYLHYNAGLMKVSVDGGTPVEIAEPGAFSYFAIDDTSVYLIGSSGQSIVKVPK